MSKRTAACFLLLKDVVNNDGFLNEDSVNKDGLVKQVHLFNQKEVIVGRGQQFGIKDLTCSKKQLVLEADCSNQIVKVRRVGKNPSILAGFPMELDQVYNARAGMVLQITPDIGYTVSFKDGNGSNNLEEESLPFKFNWSSNPTGTVLLCQTEDFHFSSISKIASFDLDGTLISTKSGYTFPKNEDDWKLWNPCVKEQLKVLVDTGFSLIMFTNQAQLETLSQGRRKLFMNKIENILSTLSLPFLVLIATNRDIFRKPATGMWEYLISKIPGQLDLDSSFYVGDAAGRIAITNPKKSADFEITDRLFARNIGIKFYTPEEYFLNEAPKVFKDVSFHPHEFSAEDYPVLGIPSPSPEVIVMVGCPASGKSFFVKTQLVGNGYKRVSRDELKSWNSCKAELKDGIVTKRNVVYDATNPDIETRKVILDFCLKLKFKNVRCFVMSTSEDRCVHNNRFRQLSKTSDSVPHTAIVSFYKRFEEPSAEEGFTSIIRIPFVPKFENSFHEKLYKQYLLGKKK